MVVIKNLSIIIMDHKKIHDVNNIIVQYSDSSSRSSSHRLFDLEPVEDIVYEDLTFFRMSAKTKYSLDEKLKKLIEELNELDTDYSIRNMETGKFYTTIKSVGAISIKFDNIKTIPKGTYKKIDELKNIKTEFGYCKGYKPTYRALEGNPINNLQIKPENIYLFSKPSENMPKLIDYVSEKIMEIDSEFEIESTIYK